MSRSDPLGAGTLADTYKAVRAAKLLVVGAGGIGCELLKNLAMTGFQDIEVIDLDTIDVTNLNRQFLFQKQHVGKSKAMVATETINTFNPDMTVKPHHGNVMDTTYNIAYFEKFQLVLNALDNVAARNHVNRMCLAADVPLIESGTKGYLGQVTVIKKGSECYECQPKPAEKTYPVCTIRNTPSLPIHCIVWAKFLFSQLFGKADDENDVTPDTNDPESAANAGGDSDPAAAAVADGAAAAAAAPKRKTVRMYAEETGYNAKKLFTKLFHDDVMTLLSMEKLWETRKKPRPLDADNLPDTTGASHDANALDEQREWTMKECRAKFEASVTVLCERVKSGDLEWDKDDQEAMDFVTAVSNLRAHIYAIPQKSRFDVKSMAGKIIPAIATTNAVIAGLIVMEAFKVLRGAFEECRTVFLSHTPGSRGRILTPMKLQPPNKKCWACMDRPKMSIKCDTNAKTIGWLYNDIIKKHLNCVEFDLNFGSKGIFSGEDDEEDMVPKRKHMFPKTLAQMEIKDYSVLKLFDTSRGEWSMDITILHVDGLEDFEVVGDVAGQLEKQAETSKANQASSVLAKRKREDDAETVPEVDDDDDDLEILDETPEEAQDTKRKKA